VETRGQYRRRNQSGPVCSLFHILLLREWPEKDGIGNRVFLLTARSRSSLNVFSKRLDRQLADRRRDGRTDRRSRLYFLLRSVPFPSRFCPYAARSFHLDRIAVKPLWGYMYIYAMWRINRRDTISNLEILFEEDGVRSGRISATTFFFYIYARLHGEEITRLFPKFVSGFHSKSVRRDLEDLRIQSSILPKRIQHCT
jgi:hypothetical protein